MARKRTAVELSQCAEPIITPFLSDKEWCRPFFVDLVELAKQISPSRAKDAAYALCLREGLNWKTANHFAKACRYLAILRKSFPTEFYQAIGEWRS